MKNPERTDKNKLEENSKVIIALISISLLIVLCGIICWVQEESEDKWKNSVQVGKFIKDIWAQLEKYW